MSSKKTNLKQLYETLPTISTRTKDGVFKPSKVMIKNLSEKSVFEKEKNEFLKKKTKRHKTRKEEASLPNSIKELIKKYADIMANVRNSDFTKYTEYKRYCAKKKATKIK